MPYTLYRYDPSTDTYDNIAYVTALDRAEVESGAGCGKRHRACIHIP